MNDVAKKRYSRQRKAILDMLMNTTSHPTAGEIYEAVKKEIPNISLGTVYRNLSELSETGEIKQIDMGDGAERYDGNVKFHGHLLCEKCGKVSDVFLEYDEGTDKLAQKACGGEITGHDITFYGICEKCKKLNK